MNSVRRGHAAKVSTAKVKKATNNFRRRRRLVVHIVLSCRHHLLRHWGKPTAPPHPISRPSGLPADVRKCV